MSQQGKTFFKPDISEFLKYESNDYFTPTEFSQRVFRFLCDELQLDAQTAATLLVKSEWLFRIEERMRAQTDLLEAYHVQLRNTEQANAYFQLLSDLSNTTHKWANCGHTPISLWEARQKESLKAFNTEEA